MADATATCPAAPDIRDTFGIFVLGTIIGTLFYGMTLLQTGMYFGRRNADEDGRKTTVLVILLWVLDTLAWIFEVYTTWWYFVVNFGSVAALEIPVWSLKVEPGLTYTVAFIAQMFFIEKIWLLSRSHLLGAFMTLLAVAAWVLGLTITGIVFDINSLVSPTIDKVNIGQKTVSTVIEVMIAVAMCYMFKSRRQGIASTDNILNRLTIFALSRGLVLGTTQMLYTAFFFAYHEKLLWVLFHFSLSKLSSNSVLASLNVREIMRSGTAPLRPSHNSHTMSFRRGTSTQSSSGEPDNNTHIVLSVPTLGVELKTYESSGTPTDYDSSMINGRAGSRDPYKNAEAGL